MTGQYKKWPWNYSHCRGGRFEECENGDKTNICNESSAQISDTPNSAATSTGCFILLSVQKPREWRRDAGQVIMEH